MTSIVKAFLVAGIVSLVVLAWIPMTTRAAVALSPHTARQANDDLEITGLRKRSSAYLGYTDLAAMPLVTKTVVGPKDLGGLKMKITGVYLEQLVTSLGVSSTDDLIDALCADRYRSYFPAEYVAAHHPILVLKVDNQTPSEWALRTHQYDPGPYFITYEKFVPSFHVLAHADEEQLPVNVVRLNFGSMEETFPAIAPKGVKGTEVAAIRGFTIATQNCLRCHNSGSVGGAKAGVEWGVLGQLARSQPKFFASYVYSPKSVAPQAHMPGNPQYDEATLAALTAYFSTFAEAR